MGLSVLSEIATASTNFISGLSGISRVMAWIGIGLIAIVITYYLFIGIVRLAKAFVNMKVKYLGLVLLLFGLVLLTIAMIIPS
ncbi:hypothetical protein Igag_1177 [Ignisphaera aggregans DSM 17230]|uniref:Uncharacterized protein n=1 Tax=Ignisphaera aggregans (strain DSM 17230 / JCM 13409 / AQ1.S1) TaxID=583356 RepID=E0SP56_IGNAA|nr:hypothetical protein Igag_1177 [Ignisphaera aggregans DSM 17230]